MKIYEGHNKEGEFVYFEVSNILLLRSKAIKTIKEIPNAEILNEEKREDVFCTFKVNEKVFEIWEPYGDSSRFHIGEQGEVQSSEELQTIKKHFSGK